MTMWRIYVNYVLVDVALFYDSSVESDVLDYLIKTRGFDSAITVIKTT
jgi:hypothetical protein